MIQRSAGQGTRLAGSSGLEEAATRDVLAWREAVDPAGIAFVTVWATGADVDRDRVLRLQAVRRDSGGWRSFDRFCAPAGDARVTARMTHDFGVSTGDFEASCTATEGWRQLESFLGTAPCIVLDRGGFEAWGEALRGSEPAPDAERCPRIDPIDLAALLTPGRGRADVEARMRQAAARRGRAPRAVGPSELLEVVAAVVETFAAGPLTARTIAAQGYGAAALRLRSEDPALGARLALALATLEEPSSWLEGSDRLFPSADPLPDGMLSSALDESLGLSSTVMGARPGWQAAAHAWLHDDPLPPKSDDAQPLDDEDIAAIERVFSESLPLAFRGENDEASYRPGQHGVARELAQHLGRRQLFLAHAPTGTGKTLAYLVPTLLWAVRNGVRVGIATYTRALQEQAMRHDVPVALRLLHEVRPKLRPRVGLLKGRANYLCWQGLLNQVPARSDNGHLHVSWTALALFALADTEGDLDRFSLRPPLGTTRSDALREHARLVRSVRASAECCTSADDRASCAADVARRRAERSHVVLTNQSFALARQEFFRHLVFDECEHLHEQAHQAWSRFFDPRAAGDLLRRLAGSGVAGATTPVGRLAAAAGGSPAAVGALVRETLDRCYGAGSALERLTRALDGFETWRERARSGRQERDLHSLLREYLITGESAELRGAHIELTGEMTSCAAALSGIAGVLDQLTLRRPKRLRRSLEQLRAELEEQLEALTAWMPRADGEVRLKPEVFYDVERDLAGRPVLATRVLLPHEHLGRYYLPSLESAAFLSATTWLRGGFESSARYLGLTRAAEPADDEDREPCEVRSYRAPEAFDYSRVLVSVPRDAPPVTGDKRGFLRYVERFVAHLAERTRGRCLVLFTNGDDCRNVGRALEGPFRERRIPFWYQRMEGTGKEELGELFRTQVDSVLLGLDTFWFGADFPGETLEYLVLVRVPYGVPDRYHHAQCAVLGREDQRRTIYLPKALAKFRQGFGRLMRKESDRGCVFVLDSRVLDPRHRLFLAELPLRSALDEGGEGARVVQGETDRCIREALAHMEMLTDVRRRGLDTSFDAQSSTKPHVTTPERLEIGEEDLPY